MTEVTKKQRIGIVVSAIWLVIGLVIAMHEYNIMEIIPVFLVIGILPVGICWGIWWIKKAKG